jgi:hypothetical protein
VWLEGQPRLQRRTALAGFVGGLFGESQVNDPLSQRLTWLLDSLGPEFARQAIEVAAARDRVPWQEVVKIREGGATLEDLYLSALPAVQRDGVAWAVGFGLGTELGRTPRFEDEVAESGPWREGLIGPSASHAWRGFGEAIGRRWGYSGGIRSRFLAVVPERWREAASRGFEDGREWVFLPEKR